MERFSSEVSQGRRRKTNKATAVSGGGLVRVVVVIQRLPQLGAVVGRIDRGVVVDWQEVSVAIQVGIESSLVIADRSLAITDNLTVVCMARSDAAAIGVDLAIRRVADRVG